MARQFFKTLKSAKAAAKARKKQVYKMREGHYFVGTFTQAKSKLARHSNWRMR
tara:strand:+ start:245 stop:403 length:159 start_codon:yes stop_codon:yes gene_type:complete